MSHPECEFEPDVLAAVLQSRWPERADSALRAHVADCGICSDVVAVAGAFESAREEVRVPDAGGIWWRSQLRARREDVTAAGRPITAAQVIAFGCAMGLFGACFGATSAWFQSALARIASRLSNFDTTALTEHSFIVVGSIAVVLLVPTAVYVVLARD